jgi:hypothetical protein
VIASTSPNTSSRANPFENYAGESTYQEYLDDAQRAFDRVADVLTPAGTLVVDVANIKHDRRITTLAWDLADRLSNSLSFEGEKIVAWTGEGPADNQGTYGYGYDHSYCLVFSQSV